MFKHIAVSVLALAIVAFRATQAELIELNPENYKSIVENPGKDVMVMYYAPWCGHCTHMKPEYEKLANRHDAVAGDVVIARIDASEHREIAESVGVTGFPTLKLYTKANKTGTPYRGAREADAMHAFIRENQQ